jgi:N-dimethylarginine dimethylaminohydrolase
MRTATPRHYLMCPPTHFTVSYSINPWMDPEVTVDHTRAVSQWERLRRAFIGLGHRVELIEPAAGLPDMVFAANGATVVDGRVLLARFRYGQRAAEAAEYLRWFKERGYCEVYEPEFRNEGEGDLLFDGERVLAGTGFRTEPQAHAEAAEFLRRPLVGLELVDARFYHLDTALAVLAPGEIAYYPGAFSAESLAELERIYPDAILATERDAEAFGLNAVSDGRHVVLPEAAEGLIARLRGRGFDPIGVDATEFKLSGGAVKCCTLELRGAPLPEGER